MLKNTTECEEDFSIKDFLLSIAEIIECKNVEYLKQHKQLENDTLISAEFFKVQYASMLREDVYFFLSVDDNVFTTKRHAECILRNLVEQVIEFKYLIKNPKVREEFSGNDDYKSSDNPVEDLCQLGSGRFKKGRKTVSQMAKDIDESIDTDEKLSLYSIYRILSEQTHNAVFHEILDIVGLVEGEEETSFFDENSIYVIYLLNSFMETYSE